MGTRTKMKKYDKVKAYPSTNMYSSIMINGKDRPIIIGGFTIDGGFYIKEPYKIISEKRKVIGGERLTYYNFVKSSSKMSKYEKEIRRIERETKDE
jgi:hypothetical protein